MTKQTRSLKTRDQILRAAEDAFAQDGYNATGVAQICQRAGVSKGAFYYHFDSKQTVFLALLENWMTELTAALEKLAHDARTIPEKIRRMAEMMAVIFQSDRAQILMFLEFWSQASRDSTVWEAVIDPYRQYTAFVTELVQQGIEEGSLTTVEPEAGAQVLVSLASGLLLQGLLDPQGADWGQKANQSIEILLKGLQRKRT